MADFEDSGAQGGEDKPAGAKAKRIPADWNPIDGIDPQTGGKCQLYVSTDTLKQIGKKRLQGLALEFAELVPYTVQARGLKNAWRGLTDWDGEDGDEDWIVYVSTPTYAYDHKRGVKVDPWKGEVFMVFVDEDKLIRRWGWRSADPQNPKLPEGHDKRRFKERLI